MLGFVFHQIPVTPHCTSWHLPHTGNHRKFDRVANAPQVRLQVVQLPPSSPLEQLLKPNLQDHMHGRTASTDYMHKLLRMHAT